MAQAMKQIAAFIVSMPRDRNGSKALIPHVFVVIFYRVVAMKGLCVKITIFVGEGDWNITRSWPNIADRS